MIRIPVSRPSIGAAERLLVAQALEEERLSMGAYVHQFEARFAQWLSATEHVSALATSSGTTALHLAVAALGCGPGDEVLVPASTFVATANAVRYTGATPVLVDVESGYGTLSPADAAAKVTPKTVGMIPVHLYGVPANMDVLSTIASRHGLWIVEDCAEALGTYRYKDDRHVGLFGHVGVFSFYGNKTVTTGEGGMLVTRDQTLAAVARKLRGQGQTERRYYHDVLGFNYRMTDIQGALGLAQMERIDDLINRRCRINQRYRNTLSSMDDAIGIQDARPAWHVGWWHTMAMVNNPSRVAQAMLARGVDTRPAFVALCDLPMYATDEPFPCARDIAARGLVLPCYDAMTEDTIDDVCATLQEANPWLISN